MTERVGGHYLIERELGRGGFAIVYAAIDERTGAPVALKMLVPPPVMEHQTFERLRREFRAVERLSHPNIAQVKELVEEGGRAYVAMERVEGPSLRARVAEQGRLAAEEALQVGVELARALEHAHKALVLHRDVKPDNVVLSSSGAKLIDFGSARIEGELTITRTGAFVGTLDYAAPEVLDGARPDARSEVYALGLVLYFALTGELPRRASAQLPPAPSDDGHRPKGAPRAIADVIARATSADPRRRYPTMTAMLRALESPKALEPSAAFCLGCGASLLGARRMCRACASRAPAPGDRLLFVDPKRSLPEAVAAIVGGTLSRGALAEVMSGARPLIRVRAMQADEIAQRLGRRGVHLVESSASNVLVVAFLAVVFALGVVTWTIGFGWFGLLGVAIAVGGGALAQRSFSSPAIVPDPIRPPTIIAPKVWTRFLAIERRLSDPAISGLLLDVTDLIRDLERVDAVDVPELHARVRRLFDAAVGAAEAIDRIDSALSRIGKKPNQDAAPAEDARAALVQRLLESVASLTAMLIGDAAAAAEKELEDAAGDLLRELELRREVMAELDAISGSAARS